MPLLALWGQICCRLAARPTCVEQVQMSGFLEVQVQLCRYRSPTDTSQPFQLVNCKLQVVVGDQTMQVRVSFVTFFAIPLFCRSCII